MKYNTTIISYYKSLNKIKKNNNPLIDLNNNINNISKCVEILKLFIMLKRCSLHIYNMLNKNPTMNINVINNMNDKISDLIHLALRKFLHDKVQ